MLQQGTSVSKLDEMLESTFDITEWRMEVERVLPALKFFTRPDNKVIHTHYDNEHLNTDTVYCSQISQLVPLCTQEHILRRQL